ncbi:AI-2E family transporter [Streptomyces sp. RB6PN25]|uniref:AI-2E family transporter n=1 Tax=Streptomyces humicola TaxID=2953240 RepID=A0ABT1PQI8_9ACTN|nr:AI-2E family transporter [Streptomyces humicola]MCQ4079939.1 AI-2E family transporter [Streptomyces humicola]
MRPSSDSEGQPGGRGRPDGERGLGSPGKPLNRRSPFFIGMAGAAGVAVTAAVVEALLAVRSVLVLIVLALFLALGLDPIARWLGRRRLPRWAAVCVIGLAALGVLAGFLSLAIPPLAEQAGQLARELPVYLRTLSNTHSVLGRLNQQFHIEQGLQHVLTGSGGLSVAGGLLGAGKLVFGTLASVVVVAVLTVYFLLGLPHIKATLFRLVPASRRERVTLITEEVFAKVGRYVIGQVMLALIAAVGTLAWLEIVGVPYALLLALFVALLDLVPVVGSTIAGVIVSLVALTVSLPVAGATGAFYTVYRLAEDYLLVPKIMSRQVEVPAMVTVVAVLIGGTLLGIAGALIAIPLAAAIRLLLTEVAFPRLDAS